MATLSVEGETRDELVRKVRRWLASLDGAPEQTISPVEAVERAPELTKDALTVATDTDVVKKLEGKRNSIVSEMNAAVAKQLLRTLRG